MADLAMFCVKDFKSQKKDYVLYKFAIFNIHIYLLQVHQRDSVREEWTENLLLQTPTRNSSSVHITTQLLVCFVLKAWSSMSHAKLVSWKEKRALYHQQQELQNPLQPQLRPQLEQQLLKVPNLPQQQL